MVIIHCHLPALKKSRLNFGLQSFLLRPSRLMAKILKQIGPSQSQMVSKLFRFYRAKDGFYRSNRISKFQRTKDKNKYKLTASLSTPYISPLNGRVLRRIR